MAQECNAFLVMISNEVKDRVRVLSLNRMRDVLGKEFWNEKERMNLQRTMTFSERAAL